MWFISVGVSVIVCVLVWIKWRTSRADDGDLDLVPGPEASPWWNVFKRNNKDHEIPHVLLRQVAKKYGPVFKIPQLMGRPIVIVSDLENIYKVLVTSGKECGGRSLVFRYRYLFEETGILFNVHPDKKWRLLRKISQRHLRQFGDGLSHLESVIMFVAKEMFSDFDSHVGEPYDPKEAITTAALNSITFLISGEKSQAKEPLVQKMREYDTLAREILPSSARIGYKVLDVLPWLRLFGSACWDKVLQMKSTEKEAFADLLQKNKDNPDAATIIKVFQEYARQEAEPGDVTIVDSDVRLTCMSMLFAGVITTSSTFHALINVLAHHPDVQTKLLDEIRHVVGDGRLVTVADRARLPYNRAVLYEMLRYQSTVASGVPHRTESPVELNGYRIPTGTVVLTLLYELHHNDEFWGDPNVFRPERFLDEAGELLPADHPNRRHLMPFGAGTRVCLGENLAMTRLFLWLGNLVQKYDIRPAPGNDRASCHPESYRYNGVLMATDYKVVCRKRE